MTSDGPLLPEVPPKRHRLICRRDDERCNASLHLHAITPSSNEGPPRGMQSLRRVRLPTPARRR